MPYRPAMPPQGAVPDAEITALLGRVERLRHRIFRQDETLAADVEALSRTANRMLGRCGDSRQEGRVRSAQALLHCIECGMSVAA